MIEIGDIYKLPKAPDDPLVDTCVVIKDLNPNTGNIDTAFLVPGKAMQRHHAQIGDHYANCFVVLPIPRKNIEEDCTLIRKTSYEEHQSLLEAIEFTENIN